MPSRSGFDKGLPAGAGTDVTGVPYQILPLKSGEKTYGLVVEPGICAS